MHRRAVAGFILFLGVLSFSGEVAQADLPPNAPGGNRGNGPIRIRDRGDLRFGTVIAGIPSTVSWSSNTAGRWFIQGEPGAEVFLDFTNLPTSLQNGGNSMPISFSGNDAAYNTKNQSGGATSFDPSAGIAVRLDQNSGHLSVWIGGTLNPPPNQQPGDYVADIVLDVIYTGN
jgi:hypothetical protein